MLKIHSVILIMIVRLVGKFIKEIVVEAVDFVMEYGFKYSKEVLKDAPDSANYVEWYPLRSRFYVCDFGCNRAVLLSELKQIVEAFELVGSYGGISNAKDHVLTLAHIEEYDKMVELQKAINLVEQCQND